MDEFKSDFTAFINLLLKESDTGKAGEIKKQYIALVKKYHPDSVFENQKKICNEYMILLNKVYAQWKAEGKVTLGTPENQNSQKQGNQTENKSYTFTPHAGVFESRETKPRTFRNYFEYLLALGKDYYWQAHQILLKDWGMENENPEATVYQALTFLEKAKQCYNTILSESPNKNNPEYVFMIQNELVKLYDMNKNITRGLSATEGKALRVI